MDSNETIGGDFFLVVESANVALRNGNTRGHNGQGDGQGEWDASMDKDEKSMDEERGQGKQH